VRPSVRKLAVAFLAAPIIAAIAAGALPASAGAQIAFGPCGDSNSFACGHLTVPLDPSGASPGSVTLAIRRRRAPVGEAHSAVIALAGGPGQSAIPFAETFTELLGPILSTRDLIVFDQRGTGFSHPLSCHGFEQPGSYHSAGQLITACAKQIGPERAFYTSPDSVADIEAIRRAGDYEKLVLWGTSYGTKVAEEYAQEFPQHVEALILDSVVPPAGPDPLDRPTFAAIPRILDQLCAEHQCAHITPNPVHDLARLVQRMSSGALHGRVIDNHGHSHAVKLSSDELLGILLEGDFDPVLRAEFPAAVRAAASDSDTAPLARLLERAAGGEGEEGEGIDVPLYYATTCEEEDFPWSRTASPHERLAQVITQIAALPAGSITPFTPANMLDFSDASSCAFWPFATPAPPVVQGPLPDVPTLILSGADDLRTPTSGARALAAQIPDSHLLVVPDTGHAVLEAEPTSCARKALLAIFAGGVGEHSIAPCAAGPTSPLQSLTPLAPERLSAIPPAHGYHGQAGRTLQAVKLTIADFARQFLLRLLETVGSPNTPAISLSTLDSGGLRAGWAQFTKNGLIFHGYSYVPGVTISGTTKADSTTLHVSGSAAAHGTLHLGRDRALVGELGGQRVLADLRSVRPDSAAPAAIVGSDAQATLDLGPGGSAAGADVRGLAGLLGGVSWPRLLTLPPRVLLLLHHLRGPA
jgi:pimeloyl-ACP methyl ester carboxylesterase